MNKINLKNKKGAFIRTASINDAEEIIAYCNKIGGESDYLTFGENEFTMSVESEQKYIENMSKSEIDMMIVAVVDEKIIGVASLSSSTKDRLKHVATLGISVLKEFWGLGIGINMMKYLIDFANSNNITKKITLTVRADNHSAITLYEKCGFVKEGLFKDDMFINGEYFDVVYMSLFLSF